MVAVVSARLHQRGVHVVVSIVACADRGALVASGGCGVWKMRLRTGVIAMLRWVNSYISLVGCSLFIWSLTTGMAASQGQTINLRVPVEVSKIYDNVYGVEVRCAILDASDHVIKNSGYLEDVRGLVNGGLSHVFEIAIELSDEEALAARKYKCNLLIGWGYGLDPVQSSSTSGPDPDEQFPQRQARPGEFFRKEVSGDLVTVNDLRLAPNERSSSSP
jgi:hypothetical protein